MLSLRVKLTLYYLAILSAVLLLFGISIYAYLSRSVLMTIDDALIYQLKKIEHNNKSYEEQVGVGESSTPGEDDYQHLLMIYPRIAQLIDERGVVTDEMYPSDKARVPVDIEKLRSINPGENEFESVKLGDGNLYRIVTRHVSDKGGGYFIRLGQSLESLNTARRRLMLVLIIAIPIALLLGSYGGLLLANQALYPVDRITRAAEEITRGDLSKRVPVPEKMDEIGRLVVTFNQMISRLEGAFERQRQFTSDASHELRTPLAVMRGDIEISLRRDRASEEYVRVLTSNLEEIVRLSRLVEDLLMLARADSGRVELRRDHMDLNKMCREMVEYIYPLAQQKGQDLKYQSPLRSQPHATLIVNADHQRIKQLLLNMLDNAIKYTDYGGTVSLGLKNENNSVVLTIADTGRGIPPEDLPHIFERFFRKSGSTSDRSAAGFGLGLSIVKWIVDSHGGTIDAKSEVGKGTTFQIKLPL